jgi:hypothetical protein
VTAQAHGQAHDHAHIAGAGQGPVAVEVGEDVGALVLLTPPELEWAELEISPQGRDDERRHVAVLARQLPGSTRSRTVYAAVYPALPAGRYRLWDTDGRPHQSVDVPAGEVVETRWA